MKSMRVKALRRVVHTIPSVADASNGYAVAALRLCENLIGLGVDVQLASIDKKGHRKMPDYVRLFPMSPGPRRLGVSAQMHQWLRKSAAAGETGLIHTHSLWQMPCVYPGWVSQWSWTPSVVSPHGTLAAAAFESGSRVKKPFWRFVQKPALDSATAFCATAQTELEDIRKQGFRQPIALLPIGVEVPQFERMQPKRRTALYLSRVHPIKQPDVLIRAWAKLWKDFPEWDRGTGLRQPGLHRRDEAAGGRARRRACELRRRADR
jgi:glycosyltransferase involved in cell wall biosynthesis